jgi:carbamoylphosphate synthase small subunit
VKPGQGGRHLADSDDAWKVIAGSSADDFIWHSDFGDVGLTHFDLNDGTLEGVTCLEVPAYSVQYHPEAAPGPHDSRYLFQEFADLILKERSNAGR